MASVEIPAPMQPDPHQQPPARGQVLICLGPSFLTSAADNKYEAVFSLTSAIAERMGQDTLQPAIVLAHPGSSQIQDESNTSDRILPVAYTPSSDATAVWLQTAADYLTARDLMSQYGCSCCLLLGSEAQSIDPSLLVQMLEAVLHHDADLSIPCFQTGVYEALLNSAMLYPLTRSIFNTDIRFPLPLDLVMSARMCEQMGRAAQKVASAAQATTPLWPVDEAVLAGFSMAEISGGKRPEPRIGDMDLNAILAMMGGTLFAEIEAKAQYWQRTRPMNVVQRIGSDPALEGGEQPTADEAEALVNDFRLAYGNLKEIWSLVLPPNSLLGLKKLSLMPAESFRMPDALWVRIVYDFALAYRLRTINRGHLMGALTPLYLAWVATYVLEIKSAEEARQHIEALARAFEADKPYLVSRWRWPDRFNP